MVIGLSTFSTLLTLLILLIVIFVYAKNIRHEIMGTIKHSSKAKENNEQIGSSGSDYHQSRQAS